MALVFYRPVIALTFMGTDGQVRGLVAQLADALSSRRLLIAAARHTQLLSAIAVTGPFAEKWRLAMDDEIRQLTHMSAFKIVDRPNDPTLRAFPLMWRFKLKRGALGEITKWKARLLARGDVHRIGKYGETYAPTLSIQSLFVLLAAAAASNMEILQYDVLSPVPDDGSAPPRALAGCSAQDEISATKCRRPLAMTLRNTQMIKA